MAFLKLLVGTLPPSLARLSKRRDCVARTASGMPTISALRFLRPDLCCLSRRKKLMLQHLRRKRNRLAFAKRRLLCPGPRRERRSEIAPKRKREADPPRSSTVRRGHQRSPAEREAPAGVIAVDRRRPVFRDDS